MRKEGMEKVMYCHICRNETIYKKYRQNNSYTESHCSVCNCYEWQNKAVASEIKKWIENNIQKGLTTAWKLKRFI
ncbi:hypothetical protein ABE042_12180 [Viridibacillus arvi]|uniref:hypothetical protein n=1 Tax=Viridibacillus arvi TaxID=263475 RepID=UPI003D277158